MVEQMKMMGFSENRCKHALLAVDNAGVEPAMNWYVCVCFLLCLVRLVSVYLFCYAHKRECFVFVGLCRIWTIRRYSKNKK